MLNFVKKLFKNLIEGLKNNLLGAFKFTKDITKKTGIGVKENIKNDAEEFSKKGIVEKVNDVYCFVRVWVISKYNKRIDSMIEKEIRTKFRPALRKVGRKCRDNGYKSFKEVFKKEWFEMG